jgi:hypothetical protein
MKNLIDYINDYINESVLSDIEDTLSVSDDDLAVELITNWINENWHVDGNLTVKFEDNTRVVDCSGDVRHPKTGKITNDMFVWGNVMGDFVFNALDTDTNKVKTFIGLGLPRQVGGELNLHKFTNVTNLEGLPDNVGSLFISGFKKLTSLKGCPTNVSNAFSITQCASLKGLDYLPKHIGGNITINHNINLLSIDGLSAVTNVVNGSLYINGNYKLNSLEGCPSIVDGVFSCEGCKALTSLSYCPEQVKYDFYCKNCATRFKKTEVASICQVGYKIDAYTR